MTKKDINEETHINEDLNRLYFQRIKGILLRIFDKYRFSYKLPILER